MALLLTALLAFLSSSFLALGLFAFKANNLICCKSLIDTFVSRLWNHRHKHFNFQENVTSPLKGDSFFYSPGSWAKFGITIKIERKFFYIWVCGYALTSITSPPKIWS